jgi:diguanylate cyclase (GGDEF)-like protein/PAS domain S-box-containing protein
MAFLSRRLVTFAPSVVFAAGVALLGDAADMGLPPRAYQISTQIYSSSWGSVSEQNDPQPSNSQNVVRCTLLGAPLLHDLLGTETQNTIYLFAIVVLLITIAVTHMYRKRAKQALWASENRYKAVFENAANLAFTLDLRGAFTSVNKAAEIYTRCPRSELMGMSYKKYTDRDQRLQVLRAFRRLYKTGEPLQDFPIRVTLKDGTKKWFELSISLLEEGGEIIGFQGSGRDVTDRVRVEEALKYSEERYRAIFATNATATLTFTERGVITLVNQEAERLLDCRKSELEGNALWTEFLAPEDADRLWCAVRLLGMQPHVDPKRIEAQIKRRDGETRHILVSLATLPGMSQYMASMIDISVWKRAEEALRISEEHYRTLFDLAGDAIFIHDLEGRFLEANKVTVERLGYERSELLEKSVFDIDNLEYKRAGSKRLDELAKGDHVVFETAHVTKDGIVVPTEVSSRLIDYDGKKAVLSIARDVSEKKQTEKALQRRLEEQMALYAVAMAGAEATSLDILIERATHAVGTILFPDHFGIGLVDAKTGAIQLHDSYRGMNVEHKNQLIPAGKGIVGRVVATAQPSRIPDVSLDPAYLPLGEPDMRSELCVPIKVAGQIAGVINAESKRLAAFTETDERLLMILAGQIATGIERFRLLDSERQRVTELEALRATMTDILAELESHRLLRVVVERACTLLSVTSGQLALFEQETQMLRVVVSYNTGRDYTDTRIAIGEGIMGKVVETSGPLLVTDYATWEGRSSQYGDARWHSVLAAPLVAGYELKGVMSVSTADPMRKFLASDQRLMSMFAQQVAIAVENARLFREIQQLAITDSLTGLYNRRHFFELSKREIVRAQRYQRGLAMLMLDIDHFKEVNDTYGHATGDQVLRTVASRCRESLREIDLVGRYGGEEFIALLPETTLDGGRFVAEQLKQRVAMPVEVEDYTVTVTASLGVVALNEHATSMEGMLEYADRALYEAKKAGRNQVYVWSEPKALKKKRRTTAG